MRILIIGAHGQLGRELCRRGIRRNFDVLPLDLPKFDITDSRTVKVVIKDAGGSLVINAAAYTAVDRAESEPELAFKVNRDGPAYLASACAEAGIPVIHVSTDYVFDGKKQGPYTEEDPVSPLGAYGESKAAGEAEVRRRSSEHVIIRTAWLYGIYGQNFVKTMLRLGNEQRILRVVRDQYGCPTWSADLAEGVLDIADFIGKGGRIPWGTYHCCGRGKTTWHGLAEKIFDLAKRYGPMMVERVVPITTEAYPTPAKRPANSVLDCRLIAKNFAVTPPPWEESLGRMIRDLRTLSLGREDPSFQPGVETENEKPIFP